MDEHCSHQATQSGDASWRLRLTLLLVLVYFVAELCGGWWTGSLALLADAGHMFSDLAALSISLFAAWLRRRPSAGQRTFGYHRVEVLAALANGALLLLVGGGILQEAWHRMHTPEEVLAGPMLLIAIGGLIVNLLSLAVLHGGHNHDLNMRGAWLHVMGDTLGSVAVIIAAALAWFLHWTLADPIASAIVCVIVVYSAWNLVRETLEILMESAPKDIPVDEVRRVLLSLPNVQSVHCLHVWTIASGMKSISAHIVLDPANMTDTSLEEIHRSLAERFPAQHLTLQLESSDFPLCDNDAGCVIDQHTPHHAVEHHHHS